MGYSLGRVLRAAPFALAGLLAAVLISYGMQQSALRVAHAQTAGAFISGWAWSENVGWIEMNSVSILPDASTVSGYAWSENIGWISFNQSDLAGCPSGTCKAWFSTVSGRVALQGWARACAGTAGGDCTGGSRTDGWDGWIALNDQAGGTYGPVLPSGQTSGQISGYSWGSDVMGWIDWRPSFGGASLSGPIIAPGTLGLTASPTKVRASTGSATLTWTGTDIPATCTLSRSPTASGYPQTVPSSPTTGSVTVASIAQNTVFTLNCDTAGTASVQIGLIPTFIEI